MNSGIHPDTVELQHQSHEREMTDPPSSCSHIIISLDPGKWEVEEQSQVQLTHAWLARRYTLQMTMEVEGHTQNPGPLVALVKAQVPGAVFVRSAAAEVSMRLPMPSTHLFADLLDELEASKGRLGLASFSISMPSLVSGREAAIAGRGGGGGGG